MGRPPPPPPPPPAGVDTGAVRSVRDRGRAIPGSSERILAPGADVDGELSFQSPLDRRLLQSDLATTTTRQFDVGILHSHLVNSTDRRTNEWTATRQRCIAHSVRCTMEDSSSLGECRRLGQDATSSTQQGCQPMHNTAVMLLW